MLARPTNGMLFLALQLLFTLLYTVACIPLEALSETQVIASGTPPSQLSILTNSTTTNILGAKRWPRVPFPFPISQDSLNWIWFQRIGSTPPTDYYTRLLTEIIDSQITIYKAQPVRSSPNPFTVVRSDVKFSMGSKRGKQLSMEVALQALELLRGLSKRWVAIRLGFVVGSKGEEIGEGVVEFITGDE